MIKIINKYSNIGKVLLFFLLITISFSLFTFKCSLLYAQETIIDSVYATPVLDGFIGYSQQNQGFFVDNWMYDMGAGDIGDNGIEPPLNSDNNSYLRSFISFTLSEINEGYYLDSAYVRIYQFSSTGNSGWWETDPQDFPVWDVPGGDTIQCIVSHIDYGNELDVWDWEKGDTGNPYTYQHNIGVMTESGEDGYRYLDVTPSVLQDYELNRDKTQYRIAFDGIDTDWDNLYDNVGFKTSNSWVVYHRPQLFLTFIEVNAAVDDLIENSSLFINNYPNPFNPSTTISFNLPKNIENVVLEIFNIKGEKVRSLLTFPNRGLGTSSVVWDGTDKYHNQVSSGVYLYRIRTDNFVSEAKKMNVIK